MKEFVGLHPVKRWIAVGVVFMAFPFFAGYVFFSSLNRRLKLTKYHGRG